jgi:hypothetical protein
LAFFSTRYAAHKHGVVSTIHKSSQKKLKGRPSIMGSTRSHQDTEKHIAMKGIRANKIAPSEGRFTTNLVYRLPYPFAEPGREQLDQVLAEVERKPRAPSV